MNLPVLQSHPDCAECPLCELAQKHIGMATVSSGEGGKDTAIICIGSYPSYDEDQSGHPFTGPSGQIFRKVYLPPLEDRATVYLTNALRCWPRGLQNFNPTVAKHLRPCVAHLRNDLVEIRKHHSDVRILALGAVATRQLLGCSLKVGLSGNSSGQNFEGTPVFCTHNPAELLIKPQKIHSVADHLQLFCDILEGNAPQPSSPVIVPPHYPKANSPRLISLDIETYGACQYDHKGRPLPEQRYFHPLKSREYDLLPEFGDVPAILSVAITLPKLGRRSGTPSEIGSNLGNVLRGMEADTTFVLQPYLEPHQRLLRGWLDHATHILGMNLPFDVSYLQVFGPQPSPLRTHHLIDLGVLNYLQSEVREERSLKTIGPVIGTHIYDPEKTIKHQRFLRPGSDLFQYNAEDTHNTLIAASRLANLIADTHGEDTPKLSDFTLTHYSNVLWNCIDMSMNGVPYNLDQLQHLETTLFRKMDIATRLAESIHDLKLKGKGSKKSRIDFMNRCLDRITQPEGALQ